MSDRSLRQREFFGRCRSIAHECCKHRPAYDAEDRLALEEANYAALIVEGWCESYDARINAGGGIEQYVRERAAESSDFEKFRKQVDADQQENSDRVRELEAQLADAISRHNQLVAEINAYRTGKKSRWWNR